VRQRTEPPPKSAYRDELARWNIFSVRANGPASRSQIGATVLARVRTSGSGCAATGASLYIVATLQYAIAQVVAASAWNPPYDWVNNYISDLGNTRCGIFSMPRAAPQLVCSPLHSVMNASFILSGLLLIAGTLLLWMFWSPRKIAIFAQVLWLIAGVGKVGVGLVPENTDIGFHTSAALNIPVGNVAILLLSIAIFRQHRMLAATGIFVFVLSLIALSLSIAAQFDRPDLLLGLGAGGMERLSGYPANFWLLMAGILALANTIRQQTSNPR